MKKNKNLAIVSCALLALTAVTATTATYAWFTVNRSASANINNVGVKADGDLEFRLATNGLDDSAGWTKDPAELDLSDAAKNPLTDISGDGLSFYRAVLNPVDSSQFTKINPATDSTYIRFTLQFRSTAENLALFIGNGTKLNATGSNQSANLSDALRMAFFDTTSLTTDKNNYEKVPEAINYDDHFKAVFSNNDITNEKYITTDDSEMEISGSKPFIDPDSHQSVFSGVFGEEVTVDSNVANLPYYNYVGSGSYSPELAKLTAQKTINDVVYYTATINIAIWLEGNDTACIISNLADDTKVNSVLNFYALDTTVGA